MRKPTGTDRDPWQRWDVLTTPMNESEARSVSQFIASNLADVSASVHSPGETLRLVWHRDSVEMFVAALTAHQANGNRVPQGIIDNLSHWLDHIADPEYLDPTTL